MKIMWLFTETLYVYTKPQKYLIVLLFQDKFSEI